MTNQDDKSVEQRESTSQEDSKVIEAQRHQAVQNLRTFSQGKFLTGLSIREMMAQGRR